MGLSRMTATIAATASSTVVTGRVGKKIRVHGYLLSHTAAGGTHKWQSSTGPLDLTAAITMNANQANAVPATDIGVCDTLPSDDLLVVTNGATLNGWVVYSYI